MRARILRLLYNGTVRGVPGLGTPEEVAARYRRRAESPRRSADRLINYYTGLGGAAGFVFGLPGYLLMPITVPANVASVAVLQLHMTAALALLAGRDPGDRATRDICVECLLKQKRSARRKSAGEEAASRAGVKLAERGIRLLAERATRYAVRAARKSAVRRVGTRRLPLLGGVLGAGSDGYVTRKVGECARDAFFPA